MPSAGACHVRDPPGHRRLSPCPCGNAVAACGTLWAVGIQEHVRKTVDELVARGLEGAVQVAAYLQGELVVDVCVGEGVGPDSLFFSYSTGKGLTGTVVHVLAEQGVLEYDLRIADVWSEFAQHGKGDVTLRHALTHSAGVPVLPEWVTADDFADWDWMCSLIAAAEPVW